MIYQKLGLKTKNQNYDYDAEIKIVCLIKNFLKMTF